MHFLTLSLPWEFDLARGPTRSQVPLYFLIPPFVSLCPLGSSTRVSAEGIVECLDLPLSHPSIHRPTLTCRPLTWVGRSASGIPPATGQRHTLFPQTIEVLSIEKLRTLQRIIKNLIQADTINR
jgi:hypothetical protein